MSNNGEEIKKECPFNGKWCGDWCPLYSEIFKQVGGVRQKMGICVFSATMIMLSEINQKTQVPQQKINIPNLFRG